MDELEDINVSKVYELDNVADNRLFPFLKGDMLASEPNDFWSPINLKEYRERLLRMQWLTQHKAGRWLSYITMYDYLNLKVIQYWNDKGESMFEIKQRVCRFFYSNVEHKVTIS
jgi:hypothetical protein